MNHQPDPRIAAMHQIIKDLRKTDLANGHCFLITDNMLPEEYAYYEYPDGRIQVEQIDETNLYNPRTIIKVLNEEEIAAVKARHEVFR